MERESCVIREGRSLRYGKCRAIGRQVRVHVRKLSMDEVHLADVRGRRLNCGSAAHIVPVCLPERVADECRVGNLQAFYRPHESVGCAVARSVHLAHTTRSLVLVHTSNARQCGLTNGQLATCELDTKHQIVRPRCEGPAFSTLALDLT